MDDHARKHSRIRRLVAAGTLVAAVPIALATSGTAASATTNHVASGLYKGMTSPVLEPQGLKTVHESVPFAFAAQLEPSDQCGGPKRSKIVVNCLRFLSPIGQYGTTSVSHAAHACSFGGHLGVMGSAWGPSLQVPASGRLTVHTVLRDTAHRPLATISARLQLRPNGTFSGSLTDVVEEIHGSGKYSPTCTTGTVALTAHRVSSKV